MSTEDLHDSLTAKDKLLLRAALQVYQGELKKAVKQNEKCELVMEASNAEALAEYCEKQLMPKLQRSIRVDYERDPARTGDAALADTPMGEALRSAVDAELIERAATMSDAEWTAHLGQPSTTAVGLTLVVDGVLSHFGLETIGAQLALEALQRFVGQWSESERQMASQYALNVHQLAADADAPDEPYQVAELRRAIQQKRGLVLAGADDVEEPAAGDLSWPQGKP